jgi:hypothetical protein
MQKLVKHCFKQLRVFVMQYDRSALVIVLVQSAPFQGYAGGHC